MSDAAATDGVLATDDLSIELVKPEDSVIEAAEQDMEMAQRIVEIVADVLPGLLDQHLRKERDRAYSALAESASRAGTIEDSIEEIQTFLGDVEARLNDMDARAERVEEACGLRPSLLTAAEAAVARLDEMAQGGRLRANDIRGIHRTLRAAVQEERARRQG